MEYINKKYIDEYLADLIDFPETPVMAEIRKAAEEKNYPILRPLAASLLNIMVRMKNPYSVLEIGTSIGYSGMVILGAMEAKGRLTTVDSDEDVLRLAKENFRKQGISDRVLLICGDGRDVLHHLEDAFDMIFLDGPKAQYLLYLPDCIRLLKNNGILICDNVLFYGMVAKDSLIQKRKITIVKRLRKFLRILTEHPILDTTIIPIGDGISVSIKKGSDMM
jgi:predicted O-methyltransferase YrrM